MAVCVWPQIRAVRTSAEIVRHARQSLIQRLNTYAREHQNLFQQVIDLLKADFMHIVQRQALAGSAIVRSQSPLFEDPVAVNIALDVLAERGYALSLSLAWAVASEGLTCVRVLLCVVMVWPQVLGHPGCGAVPNPGVHRLHPRRGLAPRQERGAALIRVHHRVRQAEHSRRRRLRLQHVTAGVCVVSLALSWPPVSPLLSCVLLVVVARVQLASAPPWQSGCVVLCGTGPRGKARAFCRSRGLRLRGDVVMSGC